MFGSEDEREGRQCNIALSIMFLRVEGTLYGPHPAVCRSPIFIALVAEKATEKNIAFSLLSMDCCFWVSRVQLYSTVHTPQCASIPSFSFFVAEKGIFVMEVGRRDKVNIVSILQGGNNLNRVC